MKYITKNNIVCITILSLVPIIFLVSMVNYCRVDIPFGDQWDFIPLLEKSHQGKIPFHELIAQHNEHRLLFPRLVMIGLAHVSKWRTSTELLLILMLGFGLFITIVLQIIKTLKITGINSILWTIPVISVILFSLNQWENWLWGWQIQIFMSVFCVIFGIFFLTGESYHWWKMILAILLGFIAIYSYANGIIYLIVGFIILMLKDNFKSIKEKLIHSLTWFILSLLIIFSYLYNYQSPKNHPSSLEFLHQPVAFFQYIFMHIGASLIHSHRLALILGMLGFLFFIFLIIVSIKIKIKTRTILPYLSMTLYSLGCAGLSGIGRIGLGTDQAMSPRYAAFSNWFWISLIILMFIISRKVEFRTSFKQLRNVQNYIPIIISFIFIVSLILSFPFWANGCFKRHQKLTEVRNMLLEGKYNDSDLVNLYPPGAFGVKRQLHRLKKMKTSLFR